MPSNTTRIAKNTLMLYFRQMLLMLVSLYTVRVVLNTLGTVDYGIYNVVAGVVTMFGFLSNSMVHSTQRFLSFEIGRGDFEQLKRVFGVCSIFYVLIAIIITLLAETVGLWFVNHKLLIPPLRMDAARWIYQFSILSFIFTILASPFTAAILAHEDMNIYAVLSIIRAALNLGIAILIQYVDWDKLKLYSMLLSIVIIMDSVI
jgi:Na+-driven multidrug efflux pump